MEPCAVQVDQDGIRHPREPHADAETNERVPAEQADAANWRNLIFQYELQTRP